MHTVPSISPETMELPLASVSDCEVRSVIKILRVRGETAPEIHRQISAVYGEECMRKSMVYRWVRIFKGGRTEVHHLRSTSNNLDAEYCHSGLQKLHKRYTKCLNLQGDYVEK